MNIAVFGAAGWAGRPIVENLQDGHRVRACDRSPDAWEIGARIDGEYRGEAELIHADISDFAAVDGAIAGSDVVVNAAVNFCGEADDDTPFLVNLKGMYNVLESARRRKVRRVVHVGSCPVVHPRGVFYDSEVRRGDDAGLYSVCKRLQEEMCRQFHEACGLSTVVLRSCHIVDGRRGIDKLGTDLEQDGGWSINWVCRHDLAQACRLAAEADDIGLEIFHIVGSPDAEQHCNAGRAREVLGFELQADFDRFR